MIEPKASFVFQKKNSKVELTRLKLPLEQFQKESTDDWDKSYVWWGPWSLEFLYRNAPIRGLTLTKRNICEICHKKLCDK